MNLYLIAFDGQQWYVEAPGFGAAIEAWKLQVAKEWGAEYEGTEEPDSVAHVHDEAVIRAPSEQPMPLGAGRGFIVEADPLRVHHERVSVQVSTEVDGCYDVEYFRTLVTGEESRRSTRILAEDLALLCYAGRLIMGIEERDALEEIDGADARISIESERDELLAFVRRLLPNLVACTKRFEELADAKMAQGGRQLHAEASTLVAQAERAEEQRREAGEGGDEA